MLWQETNVRFCKRLIFLELSLTSSDLPASGTGTDSPRYRAGIRTCFSTPLRLSPWEELVKEVQASERG
jgi:hypothetical protein